MGYNARYDEIRDNITRMRREWEAQRSGMKPIPMRAMSSTTSAVAITPSQYE